MEVVINLLQLIITRSSTLDTRVDASSECPQRFLHLRTGVGLRGAWDNTREFEEKIRVQRFEQINGFLEKIHNFFLRSVVNVAVGVECRNAGSMLAPFVFPERFVVAALVFPIGFHIGKKRGAAVRAQDGANVCVLACFIAV